MAYDQFLVCQRIFIDFERSARTRCVVQGEICDTSTIPTPMSSEMRSVLGRIRADVVHEEVGARLHPQCVSQEERYMWYCVRTHTDVVRDGIGTRPYSHRCRPRRSWCSIASALCRPRRDMWYSTVLTPMSPEQKSVLGRIHANVVQEESGARLQPRYVVPEEIGTRCIVCCLL